MFAQLRREGLTYTISWSEMSYVFPRVFSAEKKKSLSKQIKQAVCYSLQIKETNKIRLVRRSFATENILGNYHHVYLRREQLLNTFLYTYFCS